MIEKQVVKNGLLFFYNRRKNMDITPIELALKYIEQTNVNIFLTGKAGTGKTTFLRSLKDKISKRFVILAPTGVAALQAGGVTIHSFFQLPFNLYLPNTTPNTRKFSKQKINLIRSLDLIVIDEISMVRCDILDEIDYLLRHFRSGGINKPFGGVQLLMIGDLNQLPPIANDEEQDMLKEYYNNLYFFSSIALNQSKYVTITLTKVYRQQDKRFVDILNQVRDNKITRETIEELNKRYIPNILDDIPENHIVLCTHNYQANSINEKKLESLDTKEKTYQAEVNDEFPESMYPNDFELTLKEGCQVMFLKNDYSSKENNDKRRYYNGKIGKVVELADDYVSVRCEDDEQDIFVDRYAWENIKYEINKETKKVSQDVVGEFIQFPLRLAWAVTIHKAQGLTFDKAIINSNYAFSHGQVYVALSRCRSLEGMILTEKFSTSSIILDNKVKDFTISQLISQPNEKTLLDDEVDCFFDNIASIFDFTEMTIQINQLFKLNHSAIIKNYKKTSQTINTQIENYKNDIDSVDKKFQHFISTLLSKNIEKQTKKNTLLLKVEGAKKYFIEKIEDLNELIMLLLDLELDDEQDNDKMREIIVNLSLEKEIKYRLLSYFDKDKFNVKDFLSYKNDIIAQGSKLELTSIKAKINKNKKTLTNDDIIDKELFDILKRWRSEKAKESNLPAYCIIHQSALIGIANTRPRLKKDFLTIKGMGKKTITTYGKEIIEIIDDYLEQ
ncbi:MAG: AAA family ATPase [Bacteroidales bacterium]|jgi:hypothetical protein|nr:AAA family ATPase [Bacteroidales bacterium]